MNTKIEIGAKIHLSEKELQLVTDSEWILTKHVIIEKVYELFGNLLSNMKQVEKKDLLSEEIKNINGKISRGENYKGLPYVILDYPNIFSGSDIYAIRTMFWWGNFFSSTLHVKGIYKKRLVRDPENLYSFIKANKFSICTHDNEWHHDHTPDNYIEPNELDRKIYTDVIEKDFLKLSKFIPLTQWNEGYDFLMNSFNQIMDLQQF